MSYKINNKYVHPFLLLREDMGHHTMCHNCGAVRDTALCGGVVVCKRCGTFWDKNTCQTLSKREAMLRLVEDENE